MTSRQGAAKDYAKKRAPEYQHKRDEGNGKGSHAGLRRMSRSTALGLASGHVRGQGPADRCRPNWARDVDAHVHSCCASRLRSSEAVTSAVRRNRPARMPPPTEKLSSEIRSRSRRRSRFYGWSKCCVPAVIRRKIRIRTQRWQDKVLWRSATVPRQLVRSRGLNCISERRIGAVGSRPRDES
jgi:hypothetical protein